MASEQEENFLLLLLFLSTVKKVRGNFAAPPFMAALSADLFWSTTSVQIKHLNVAPLI